MQYEESFKPDNIGEGKLQMDEAVTDFSIESLLKPTTNHMLRKEDVEHYVSCNSTNQESNTYASLSSKKNKSYSNDEKFDTDLENNLPQIQCRGFRIHSEDGVFQESCSTMFKRSECFDAETSEHSEEILSCEKERNTFLPSQCPESKPNCCVTIPSHETIQAKDGPKKALIKRAKSYYSTIQNEIEVQFVRALLDLLLHPPSVSHQQWVVQILKENDKVRHIFQLEKEKLGIKRIPVFKQKRNEDLSFKASTNESTHENFYKE